LTEEKINEIRERSGKLRDELQDRFPEAEVTRTEWTATGGIQVSVTWPFEREATKR
jgi:hypothetical protein